MNKAIARRRHDETKILEVRALQPKDLEILRQPVVIHDIKRIRDSHHNIARRIALGQSYTKISAEVGMSITRISVLARAPSMVELINKYRAEVHESWREHVDHMAELAVANMVKGERQIADQLDDADATDTPIPLRDLARITADRMDRFGYGKHTTSTNINVGFAAKLEAAITRSRKVVGQ